MLTIVWALRPCMSVAYIVDYNLSHCFHSSLIRSLFDVPPLVLICRIRKFNFLGQSCQHHYTTFFNLATSYSIVNMAMYWDVLPFAGGFEPIVDIMPGAVQIDTGSGGFMANLNIIESYLPGLGFMAQHGYISIPALVDQIYLSIDLFNVRRSSISRALRTFFGFFRNRRHIFESLEQPLLMRLNDSFDQDLQHRMYRYGLYSSRTHFVVLAVLARWARSAALASWLVTFFYDRARDIMHYERHERNWLQWMLAIMELQSLISCHDFKQCLRYLAGNRQKTFAAYHNLGFRDGRLDAAMRLLREVAEEDDWRRGRSRHRYLLPAAYPPRSRTVPAQMHMLVPPPQQVIHQPLPSPSLSLDMPMDHPFIRQPYNEIEEMQMRQDMVEMQVADLQEQVHMATI